MDPITALANLVTAITNLVVVLMEGASPAQKEKMWEWYIKDVTWWRKKFGVDTDDEKAA